MKVLFTGMGSAHCKKPDASLNKTFFTVFSSLFSDIFPEADVEWQTPSVTWDEAYLSKFDLVFVGMLPPTAMSANKVYGAMSIIDILYDSPKLHLVLDSPQLWQYESSLAAVAKTPEYLVSSFYAKRYENRAAHAPEVLSRLKNVSQRLLSGGWPSTIYPTLPWKLHSDVVAMLPNAADSLVGINIDSYLIEDAPVPSIGRSYVWTVDNEKASWYKKLSRVITLPAASMKASKKSTDADVENTLKGSLGALVASQDRKVGTWWTYRYIQALNTLTPIVTDWRESSRLSSAWSYLAYQVEDMSEIERLDLATKQVDSYLSGVPGKGEIRSQFEEMFNSKLERSR